jgi:hypothetical protein
MITDWDIYLILDDIDRISRAEKLGNNGWERKKELYELLWYIEDKLEKCDTYDHEHEFVKSRREQKIIKKLEGES